MIIKKVAIAITEKYRVWNKKKIKTRTHRSI